ncbi:heme peroxidase [Entophlyctis luteolus]|nr:heme peroxidase [Entophlyctis luteolus]
MLYLLTLAACAAALCPFSNGRRDATAEFEYDHFYNNTMDSAAWATLRADLNGLFSEYPTPFELANNSFPFGATVVRLSWHDAGTADVSAGTGGPHAVTRFQNVQSYGSNLGLYKAINALEPLYNKFNGSISHADLWSFAAAVFISNNNGPEIKWRPGRADAPSFAADPIPDTLLPGATQTANEFRPIFQRMGFSDQEIVALLGAHNLGWAVIANSGYLGGWTTEPWWFSNQYYTRLLEVNTPFYTPTTNNGSTLLQWQDPNQFMMLPADRELVEDSSFNQYVQVYAASKDEFYKDFAAAFQKLQELNVAHGLGEYVSTISPNVIEYQYGSRVLSSDVVTLYYIFYGDWNDPSQIAKLQQVGDGISSTDYWTTIQAFFQFDGSKSTPLYASGNLKVSSQQVIDTRYSIGRNLTGNATEAYILSQIQSGSLPNDPNGVYVFFFSDDVAQSSAQGTFCNQYCTYHDVLSTAQLPYIVVGRPDKCSAVCNNPVMPSDGPTGDVAIDSAISAFTMSLVETITNPFGQAWVDVWNRTPITMCYYNYGDTYETETGPFNLMINESLPILVNAIWNPSTQKCVFSFNGIQDVYNSSVEDDGSIVFGNSPAYAWTIGGLTIASVAALGITKINQLRSGYKSVSGW